MKLLALVLAALTLLPVAASAQQASPTLQKIADTGVIRMGYRESSVPHSYLDGTRPIGFSIC